MNLLERELDALRARRVRLRKSIEHMQLRAVYEEYNRYGPDGLLDCIAGLEVELRHTARRWQELHLLLGRPLAGKPVKLR